MSHVTTPTFRVELPRVFTVVDGSRWEQFSWSHSRWDCKAYGRPNDSNLVTYVEALEASTLPGACNEHLGLCRISQARVVRQSTGEVVASYGDLPMFTVQA